MLSNHIINVLRSLFCVLIVALPLSSFAADTRLYGYNRLTCSLVKTMCQDRNGFIWIGTEYGLNRFDGYRFEHYFNVENDPTSLASNDVRCLYTDRQNRLWIGSSRRLQLYDASADCFRTIPFTGIDGTAISQVIELHNGRLLVVTTGRGVFELDGKGERLNRVRLDYLKEKKIVRIHEDRSGRVWTSTSDGWVYCFNSDKINSRPFVQIQIGEGRAKSFGETRNGRIYMCTDTRVYTYNEALRRLDIVKESGMFVPNDIRDCRQTKDGNLIVLCFNGKILRIDGENGTMAEEHSLSLPFTIVNPGCTTLMEDRDCNIWVGMMRHGLLMYPHSKPLLGFTDFASPERPQGIGAVCAVACSDKQIVYLGTSAGRVYACDMQGNILKEYTLKSAVYSLAISGNTLYVGTYVDGLASVNLLSGVVSYQSSLNGSRVSGIASDNQGRHYIAVFGKGVMTFGGDATSLKPLITPKTGRSPLKDSHVNYLFTDSRQRLWMGHFKGVDIYDIRSGRFLREKTLTPLDDVVCYFIMEDHNGIMWMGTAKGLYAWNPATKVLKKYTVSNGLSNNVVCGIAEDVDGNIWCSTFDGVCMLRPSDGRITRYYDNTNAGEKEFSRGACCTSPDKSEIYFGGVGGITWFLPADLHAGKSMRPVMLTNVVVGGKSFSPQALAHGRMKDCELSEVSEIYLSSKDNTFTLDFSTMDFVNAESSSYEFRIRGRDEDWTPLASGMSSVTFSHLSSGSLASGMSSVTFSHLSSGSYTVEVRAIQGGQYTPSAQIRIHIAYPWYLSWPAVLVYVLVAGAVLYLIYVNFRHRRAMADNEERTRFFINIAHDIRSPMTLIVSPLETLLNQDYDYKTKHLLRTMYRNSQRIISMMNELLDIRRIDKGQLELHFESTNIVALVKGIVEIFGDLAARHNIQLKLEGRKVAYACIDRNQMDKVLVNLMDNAFKYTPDGGTITIRVNAVTEKKGKWVRRNTPFVSIEVEDTGKGIEETEATRLFDRFYQGGNKGVMAPGFGIGLNLCKLIVEKHHGTIEAHRVSKAGGSLFRILLPLAEQPDVPEFQDGVEDKAHVHSFLLSEPTEEERKHRRSTKPANRYRILIVDDDDDIRDFLTTELSDLYRVSTCRNGEEALRMAVSQLPDIIVSDIIMPEMDGITLLRRLKANTSTCHIPVVMLTTKSERIDRLKGLELGADAYLAKPFTLNELETVISNLINSRLLLRGKYSGSQEQEKRMENIEVKGNDEQLMERIMKSVNAHLDDAEFSVEMLASEVGLSRVQLHRRMKDMTGMATSDFIRNLRIKQAAILLAENKVNVSQVAYAVGFVNRTHFSTVFKKYYGISPQEYAEEHREKGHVTETNGSETTGHRDVTDMDRK